MSGTGCNKLPFAAGCNPALANSEAIHWMATSSPFCKDMRPSSASEARKVRSARKASSRMLLNPVAKLAGTGCCACNSAPMLTPAAHTKTMSEIFVVFMGSNIRNVAMIRNNALIRVAALFSSTPPCKEGYDSSNPSGPCTERGPLLFIAAQFVFAYFCIAGVFPGELAWVQQLTSNLPAAVAGTLRSTEPSQTSPSLDLYIYVLKPNNGTAEDPAVVMVF